jgi:hypothetical protein
MTAGPVKFAKAYISASGLVAAFAGTPGLAIVAMRAYEGSADSFIVPVVPRIGHPARPPR